MIDPDRVLRPLRDEEGAIGRLATYRSTAELADAVVAVRDAVDRVLRLLLRADAGAPDDVRLIALSTTDLPHDRLVTELRRRELISLATAGAVHELERASTRAENADVKPADADLAGRVVRALQLEVGGRPDATVRDGAHRAVEDHALEEPIRTVPSPSVGGRRVRLAAATAVALAAVIAIFVMVRTSSGPSLVERAIAAFRSDDLTAAEALLDQAIAADSGDVTAMLYLGRIYRRQARFADAAAILSAAEDASPEDPDVRRELGNLFMDLDRPESAARQFDLARELDPGNELNWIGLIRALRAAGDPQAEVWLERAPAQVRAALTTVEPPRDGG
jgi:tetratricopeptide (TPR) repeat protein